MTCHIAHDKLMGYQVTKPIVTTAEKRKQMEDDEQTTDAKRRKEEQDAEAPRIAALAEQRAIDEIGFEAVASHIGAMTDEYYQSAEIACAKFRAAAKALPVPTSDSTNDEKMKKAFAKIQKKLAEAMAEFGAASKLRQEGY